MSSILTNTSAMVALQTLKGINSGLNKVQDEISTGKSVGSAKDNAAVWAISKVMESDVKGFSGISDSLALGASTVSVARNAAESITDLLTEIKGKIVAAQEENVDREKIQTDIEALRAQIGSVVGAAQFNGQNLIDGSSTVDMEILSSLDRDTNGNVTSSSISVVRQNLSVTDSTATQQLGTANGGADQAAADAAFTVLTAATVGAGADTTGTAVNAFYQNEDLTDETANAPTSLANGATAAFSVNEVQAGATYQIYLSDLEINVVGGGTTTGARTFSYVASEADSTTDVANELASQINAFFGAATGDGDYTAVINSTTNTAGDVNLNEIQITNNSGAAINFSAMITQGGTAGTSASSGGLGALASIDVTQNAEGALTAIDGLIQQAIDAAAEFGSAQSRIEIQSDFIGKLSDNLQSGIGSMVDADMEAASARLQALQVQQQLATQSLSIANQAPQNILSLFR
ncbi:flagellin [Cereibacter sphaeroides]|uniref:flagellin n=1 Tax=Cereibacter sphaeroides TaxID=1063 RepID=UPI001F48FA7F|nr:flagellin [Cereibacter sphaeroides]MCE6950215.1 flagellin [Cereibacter sphaeroides]